MAHFTPSDLELFAQALSNNQARPQDLLNVNLDLEMGLAKIPEFEKYFESASKNNDLKLVFMIQNQMIPTSFVGVSEQLKTDVQPYLYRMLMTVLEESKYKPEAKSRSIDVLNCAAACLIDPDLKYNLVRSALLGGVIESQPSAIKLITSNLDTWNKDRTIDLLCLIEP